MFLKPSTVDIHEINYQPPQVSESRISANGSDLKRQGAQLPEGLAPSPGAPFLPFGRPFQGGAVGRSKQKNPPHEMETWKALDHKKRKEYHAKKIWG